MKSETWKINDLEPKDKCFKRIVNSRITRFFEALVFDQAIANEKANWLQRSR